MNASTITTPNADCDADEADNDLEAIEFDDAQKWPRKFEQIFKWKLWA
jgi:hypothetical protein